MSTVRPPTNLGKVNPGDAAFDLLGHEVMAEKAAALGRSGEAAERALRRLKEHGGELEGRAPLLREAADAVYAYFIQRELCGFRRNDGIIREMGIPKEVLSRLGAK